ncbi:MAG TPA: glycoside hydrolase family 15 protein [Gaiellaceae bacterium]|nr:glycoside hydrolase family 15 protein [Gaiellaceae bacterium]
MALVADLLARKSVDVLLRGQAPSGALVASPSYATYQYAWLRDGAFCAHALDVVGERAAAAAWHTWVCASVEAQRTLVESAIAGVEAGRTLPPESFPPARYTLDGRLEHEGDEPWPNFQVDGYGMWLWSLEQHLAGRPLERERVPTVELVARYLAATWRLPCFSCWEELDGGEHAATYGATVAGLTAAGRLLGDERWLTAAESVRADLLARFVRDGAFVRGPGDPRVDGSLLWLAVPFAVLPPDDPTIRATVAAVEHDLACLGGVYRYLGDTYYGGGQWLLLTSSLAWHHARAGNRERAAEAQDWVRAQALPGGELPEQVTGRSQSPAMVEPWVARWGTVATPLLWSHAMYLLAEDELQR